MKAKAGTKEKDFDTVKTFRAIKEKISKDIANMDVKQIVPERQKSTFAKLTPVYNRADVQAISF